MSKSSKTKDNTIETSYNLEAREPAGPTMAGAEKIYTIEEQAELLRNYFEVPRELWKHLPTHGWFRYIDKDGKFCTGGLIKSVTGDEYLTYGWINNPAYKNVFFADVSKLYKKYAYNASIEIGMLITSVRELKDYVKKQNSRIIELELRAGVISNSSSSSRHK